jgi:ribosomal-protein-alanine N-acetyltransferase
MTQGLIDAVAAIENASFSHPWSRSSFQDELHCPQAIDYVATPEDGSRVVAFICLRRLVADWHLLKIAVDPAFRRRGIATALMNVCLNQARAEGMDRIYLELRRSNLPAKAFYAGLGFRQIGTRRQYYPETGEDALVFVKEFKEAL